MKGDGGFFHMRYWFRIPAFAVVILFLLVATCGCGDDAGVKPLSDDSSSYVKSEIIFDASTEFYGTTKVPLSVDQNGGKPSANSEAVSQPDAEKSDDSEAIEVSVRGQTIESSVVDETSAAEAVSEKQEPEKVVYLTFDDGPSAYTVEVLDILDKYDIKATFFVIGTMVEQFPDALREAYERGNAIGCHSYDHNYKRTANVEGLTAEIEDWEETVFQALGELPESKLFRFPGGSVKKDASGVKAALKEKGYRGFDWNCVNNDCILAQCPEDKTHDEWMKETFTRTYKFGSNLKDSPLIVLNHDVYRETVDMLEWAIDFLISEGYTFRTLDELEDGWYY